MDRYLRRGLLAATICLLAAPASAADFDYSWLSAGALNGYPGGGIIEHGWFLDGSAAVASQFTVQGDFYRTDLNGCPPYVPVGLQVPTEACVAQASNDENYRLGGGWHLAVADDADMLVDAYYAHDQSHLASSTLAFILQPTPPLPHFNCPAGQTTVPLGCEFGSTQDSASGGYRVDLGMRIRCGCTVEFRGFLGHQYLSDTGSANFVSGEASYAFTAHWMAVLAMSRYSPSLNQYRLGLRYRF